MTDLLGSKKKVGKQTRYYKMGSSSMISYAQNYEDVVLWRALRHIEKGCYIDIGAWDPVIDSVSMFFYTQGWRGIHAEPNPLYAKKLQKARPDETVIEAVVGNTAGPVDLYVIDDTGLTTCSKKIRDQHITKGFRSQNIKVPTRSLASIFDEVKSGDIHWLKIDAEGLEEEVIRSWGNNKTRPWVVVVESTLPSSRTETWHGMNELKKRGYEFVYFDALNKFYVHELHSELIPSFKWGPNIFDNFILAEHKAIRDQGIILDKDLKARTEDLVRTREVLVERTTRLEKANTDLNNEINNNLKLTKELAQGTTEIVAVKKELGKKTELLEATKTDLKEKTENLREKNELLQEKIQLLEKAWRELTAKDLKIAIEKNKLKDKVIKNELLTKRISELESKIADINREKNLQKENQNQKLLNIINKTEIIKKQLDNHKIILFIANPFLFTLINVGFKKIGEDLNYLINDIKIVDDK